ncbi:PREDICTED: LOW QUALITY PROTEIN, partial [Prunus dulcis]
LAAMMSTFTPLLKKGQPYIWSKECQEAYQQVQQLIARLPTMRAPTPGFPLKLYLAATNTARLRHYFLAHKVQLVVKSDPVRYLLTRPVLSGRLARWLLQLSEFDIVCTTPKAIRGQAVIDMLALFPEVEESTLSKEVLGELPEVVATVVEEASWTLYFDGSSTTNGGGA